ncbi:MAG: cystathionine gamma-synthase family protein [Candidatus Longimicrobiales bacterium M2_2A_002]
MSEKNDYRHTEIAGRKLRPETQMMGYGYDPHLSEGSVKCPIFQTSTFVFKTAEEGKAFFELAYGLRERGPAEEPGLIYSRINNPDLEILEDRLSLWDGAEAALVFSSGMSAIATTMLTFLRPGDAVVHSDPVYGGTEFLLFNILPQFGVRRFGFRAGEEGGLERAVAEAREAGPLKVIFAETPANPTNALVDIARCAELADQVAADGDERPVVAVDNTFLGPLWQKPLEHGADLVLYSLTKYVGGHSDLIAGAVLGDQERVGAVAGMRTILGTMADAWTGWLLMRSLETLKLRMTSQMKNARYVAEFLQEHPKVREVHYLGFLEEGDPQYGVYQRQCLAPGGTFSFDIDGGEKEAFRLLNALKLAKLAVSLGGTETLMQHPGTMTHSDIPPDHQKDIGITPGMVRISVGVEDPQDLIADLTQALEAV